LPLIPLPEREEDFESGSLFPKKGEGVRGKRANLQNWVLSSRIPNPTPVNNGVNLKPNDISTS